MAIPVVIIRALPTAARALAKPRVFKRFLGTRAGKRAALKYGTMLVKSKDVRNAVNKFIKGNGSILRIKDRKYKRLEQEYALLLSNVEMLEIELSNPDLSQEKLQELTFALGRQVVKLRQNLAQMQECRHNYFQKIIAEFRRTNGLDKVK